MGGMQLQVSVDGRAHNYRLVLMGRHIATFSCDGRAHNSRLMLMGGHTIPG